MFTVLDKDRKRHFTAGLNLMRLAQCMIRTTALTVGPAKKLLNVHIDLCAENKVTN